MVTGSSICIAAAAVTWSIMHPVVVEPDYMRRVVGNAAFPNGTITVEFKEVPGAKVEVDADPRYAKDFAVTEKVADGIRTVTIAKKGASYPGIRSIALIGAK